jgi:hypothetical protein
MVRLLAKLNLARPAVLYQFLKHFFSDEAHPYLSPRKTEKKNMPKKKKEKTGGGGGGEILRNTSATVLPIHFDA